MNRIRKILFFLLFFFILLWIVKKSDFFAPVRNIFKAKPVVIDETPVLIKEIRSIGQLITYAAFDEVVVDSVVMTNGAAVVNALNRFSPIPMLPSAEKKIVLIGRGKVLAGVDLKNVLDSSMRIKNDTVFFQMPKTKILDAILNPSDFETFIEKGVWRNEEVVLVKAKARDKMIQRAIQGNILLKADSKAKTTIYSFINNLGYSKVVITN